MKPEISIITPVYNSERYLQKMINSVLNQSFRNWELIIIDDKSTDRSLDIIKDTNDKRIRFKVNKNFYSVLFCIQVTVHFVAPINHTLSKTGLN